MYFKVFISNPLGVKGPPGAAGDFITVSRRRQGEFALASGYGELMDFQECIKAFANILAGKD